MFNKRCSFLSYWGYSAVIIPVTQIWICDFLENGRRPYIYSPPMLTELCLSPRQGQGWPASCFHVQAPQPSHDGECFWQCRVCIVSGRKLSSFLLKTNALVLSKFSIYIFPEKEIFSATLCCTLSDLIAGIKVFFLQKYPYCWSLLINLHHTDLFLKFT